MGKQLYLFPGLAPPPAPVTPERPEGDLVDVPPEVVALGLPLPSVVAVQAALSAGAKILAPEVRGTTLVPTWRFRLALGAPLELLLPVGYDATALRAVGFRRGRYPFLRRVGWFGGR